MAALFTEKGEEHLKDFGAGIAEGCDVLFVMELSSGILHVVIEYLISKGSSHVESKLKMHLMKTWHRNVGGVHRHAPVIILNLEVSWAQFVCYKTVCKSNTTVERHQQLARFENTHQVPSLCIVVTFPDLLLNFRLEYDRLRDSCTRLRAQEFAKSLDENELYTNFTTL